MWDLSEDSLLFCTWTAHNGVWWDSRGLWVCCVFVWSSRWCTSAHFLCCRLWAICMRLLPVFQKKIIKINHDVFKRTRGALIAHLLSPRGIYERILKISDFNLDSKNVASLQKPIWAVVPSDCTPRVGGGGEKYVTSEFADVAQPPCGKPPTCTHANQHFYLHFLKKILFCDFYFYHFYIFHKEHEVCSPFPVIYSSSVPVWELPLLCKCRVLNALDWLHCLEPAPSPVCIIPGSVLDNGDGWQAYQPAGEQKKAAAHI